MLNITLVTIGKVKEAYLNEASLEYLKRIKPYGRLVMQELKAEPFSVTTKDKAKQIEAGRIEAVLEKRSGAEIYLLAEHGTQFNSLDFAAKIKDRGIKKRVCLKSESGIDPKKLMSNFLGSIVSMG